MPRKEGAMSYGLRDFIVLLVARLTGARVSAVNRWFGTRRKSRDR